MAKKPRTRRSSLRSASKVQERGLQATADQLNEDPSVLIPRCEGHRTHFRRAQKAIAKVWERREDPDKLRSLSRRGHPLGRAYAATLLVAQDTEEGDGKVIMLQFPTPWGKVPIASRGKAKAAHLAGVQYFDDRKLRLVLVFDLVKRKRLAFYSLPGLGIACGGKAAKPPAAFVEAEAASLELMKDPEGWACPHAIHAPERLTVNWRAAGVKLRRCSACASEGNTLQGIVEHIAARDVLGQFEVSVDLEPLPSKGAKPVELPRSVPLDPSALERYRKGELDDEGLLDAQRAARLAHLRTLPGPLYVNLGTSYGRDMDAFLESLEPSPIEATALRGALEGWDTPVVMERGTAPKVLAELWADRGVEALEAVGGSREVAEEIHRTYDVAGKGVGPALHQAQARGSRHATDRALPIYSGLPPLAKLADQVARAHRAHGRAAALGVLEKVEDPRLKGIAHAFELALEAAAGKDWKYAPLDRDVAQQLKPLASALLKAEPGDYDAALRALARAAGVTEDLRRAE